MDRIQIDTSIRVKFTAVNTEVMMPTPAVAAGADAVLAASVFHFGDLRIPQVKDALREAGHQVR